VNADAPRWRRRPEVLWRRLHAGVMLLVPGADEPAVASGVAATVWLALATPRAVDELVDVVVAQGLPDGAPGDGAVPEALSLLESSGFIEPST
jgi:hypothetical protein